MRDAQEAKTTVSAPLVGATVRQLDAFCANAHISRADVLRGLVDALLIDGKQFIFREWREQVEQVFPAPRPCDRDEAVLDALTQYGCPVRARRLAAHFNGKQSRASVYRALESLVNSGKAEKTNVKRLGSRTYALYRKAAPPSEAVD
jgi:hypothetical protein